MSSYSLIQLTWLRGIAALLVVFSHIYLTVTTKYFVAEEVSIKFISLLDLGTFGVTLFFTLSGCTLFLSNAKIGFDRVNDFFTFYLKRFFRVWPAFFVSFWIYLVFAALFGDALLVLGDSWLVGQFTHEYGITDVVNYLVFIFNFTGPQYLFNNAYWSLPVEFQYYLIFPLIILLMRRFGFFAPVFIAVLLYLTGKLELPWADSKMFFWLSFTFCFGMCIGYIYTIANFRLPVAISCLLLLLCYFFLMAFRNGLLDAYKLPSDWSVWGFISIIVVFIVVFTNFTLPKAVSKFLSFYGDISFSLYLYHNFVLGMLAIIYLNYEALLVNCVVAYFVLFTIIISTTIAYFSYTYIEKRFITLGRDLAHRFY